MNVLLSEPWSFDLIEHDDGTLRLVVVCGTIGLYEVVMTLDHLEREEWSRRGEAFIRELAGEIVDPCGRYAPRCSPYERGQSS